MEKYQSVLAGSRSLHLPLVLLNMLKMCESLASLSFLNICNNGTLKITLPALG